MTPLVSILLLLCAQQVQSRNRVVQTQIDDEEYDDAIGSDYVEDSIEDRIEEDEQIIDTAHIQAHTENQADNLESEEQRKSHSAGQRDEAPRNPSKSSFQQQQDQGLGNIKKRKRRKQPKQSQPKENENANENTKDAGRKPKNIPANQGSLHQQRDDFLLEYVAVTMIVISVLTFANGWRSNESIARSWFIQFEDLLREQFMSVGADAGLGPDDNDDMFKESMNCFKIYASGRKNCKGMLCTLSLKKRQDLISSAIQFMNPTSHDNVLIEVPLSHNVEDFVLMICATKKTREMRKNTYDLSSERGVKNIKNGLPEKLSALTDCSEAIQKLFTSKKKKSLLSHELFDWLHITDDAHPSERTLVESKKCLRVQYKLPPSGKMESLQPLMLLTFDLIDTLSTLSLSHMAKKRTVSIRKQIAQQRAKELHTERQQLVQQKKLEKEERERQRYETLTPKQKKKVDAQNEKKRLKKMRKRAKNVVKIGR